MKTSGLRHYPRFSEWVPSLSGGDHQAPRLRQMRQDASSDQYKRGTRVVLFSLRPVWRSERDFYLIKSLVRNFHRDKGTPKFCARDIRTEALGNDSYRLATPAKCRSSLLSRNS